MTTGILQNKLILILEESPVVKLIKEIPFLCLARISETGLANFSQSGMK